MILVLKTCVTPGQSKKIENKELEALLKEDPRQTQEDLAKPLGLTLYKHTSKAILWLMERNQDIERRFSTYEQLQNGAFCIR